MLNRWNFLKPGFYEGINIVLYACEAGSSECATYRTGGISEVEVTRQTFVPKYANELLSPGR